MRPLPILIPTAALAEFCRGRHIRRLSLFGSVLRGDFRADSDVDVLVEFEAGARHDLWDRFFMLQELQAMLGRPVDLINADALKQSDNWIRRRAILETAETVYVSRCPTRLRCICRTS